MNKNMMGSLIGAGSLTVLIVALVLLFGGNGRSVSAGEGLNLNMANGGVSLDDYETVQQQNEQLQEALMVMQEREGLYQTQLEEANSLLSEQSNAYGEAAYEADEDEYEEEAYEADEDEDEDEAYEAVEDEDEDEDE